MNLHQALWVFGALAVICFAGMVTYSLLDSARWSDRDEADEEDEHRQGGI
jgi:hypothetical protein